MLQGLRNLPDRAFRIAALLPLSIGLGLLWAGSQWAYAFLVLAANLWLLPYIRNTNREEQALRARLERQGSTRRGT
ncbi:MAG: hypothetical protein LPK18_06225 [Pseudomonadaceae bacterium]|nr:hypothetical protein [Pseudomonadaceae bacterium]